MKVMRKSKERKEKVTIKKDPLYFCRLMMTGDN